MFLTTNNEVIGGLNSRSRHGEPYAHQLRAYYYPLLVLSWVIKQLFRTFLCNSQNSALDAVDDPMHCWPWPSASGNSVSGHPQHLVGDSYDCCTERYEIVVHCFYPGHIMTDKMFSIKQGIEPSVFSGTEQERRESDSYTSRIH